MSNNRENQSTSEKIKAFFIDHKLPIAIIAILAIAGVSVGFIFLDVQRSENRLVLATTTSTYDSGLLGYLLPEFEEETGIQVDILSQGTGQALETGRRGDADMLLVHAREREDQFVNNSYGIHRTCIMFNDFILVGPTDDPANIGNADNITIAMTRLYDAGVAENSSFYSRGDDSGTHTKERSLWEAAGYDYDTEIDRDDSTWYSSLGKGMGETLTQTEQSNNAYTLADRGTWLSMKDNLDTLDINYANNSEVELLNPYGAIPIDPYTFSHVNYKYAMYLTSFLVSERGQNLIENYTVNGEQLFTPAFGKCNETHSCPTTQEEINFWTKFSERYSDTFLETATSA